MERLRLVLRDPIWQFVGAVVGLVALYVAFPKTPQVGELRVVRVTSTSLNLLSSTASSGTISLMAGGKEVGGDRISVHFYTLQNKSAKPILGNEFHEGLLVRASREQDQILSVKETCTDVCSISPMKWQPAKQSTFVAVPSVINPGEQLVMAVYVLSEHPLRDAKDAAPHWAARITNVNLGYYVDQPVEPNLAEVRILLEGWAILFLLCVAMLLFVAGVATARFAGALRAMDLRHLVMLTALTVMAFSSAEVAAHLVSRKSPLAPVGWVVIAFHGLFLLALIIQGVRKRALQNPTTGVIE